MKKNIKEEINRIKSLFTEERLYGNLVNETCDDLGDAVEFLQTQGYTITKNDDTPCIGPNTDISVAFNEAKSITGEHIYRVDTTKYGCRLKIFNKYSDVLQREGRIFTINLYEDSEQKQFTAYYMLKQEDCCKKSIGGLTKNFYDLEVGGVSLLKLRYIKIWGTWKVSSGEIVLENSEVDAILNENEKEVTRSIDVGGTSIDVGHNKDLFSENGNQNACGTATELLQHNLSWLNLGGSTKLKTLISKI